MTMCSESFPMWRTHTEKYFSANILCFVLTRYVIDVVIKIHYPRDKLVVLLDKNVAGELKSDEIDILFIIKQYLP